MSPASTHPYKNYSASVLFFWIYLFPSKTSSSLTSLILNVANDDVRIVHWLLLKEMKALQPPNLSSNMCQHFLQSEPFSRFGSPSPDRHTVSCQYFNLLWPLNVFIGQTQAWLRFSAPWKATPLILLAENQWVSCSVIILITVSTVIIPWFNPKTGVFVSGNRLGVEKKYLTPLAGPAWWHNLFVNGNKLRICFEIITV